MGGGACAGVRVGVRVDRAGGRVGERVGADGEDDADGVAGWGVEAWTGEDASGGVTADGGVEAGDADCVLAAGEGVVASAGVGSCSSSCSLHSVLAGPDRH